MAISRKEKETIVSELAAELKQTKGLVFADFRGLAVDKFEALRRELREQGASVKVVKLTLLKKALAEAGLANDVDFAVPVATAYSSEDEVVSAKILAKFSKDSELKILGGLLSEKTLDASEVKNLAKLPGKDELRGQVVSVLAGPMRGLVGVLAGTQRSLLYALQAMAEKKA